MGPKSIKPSDPAECCRICLRTLPVNNFFDIFSSLHANENGTAKTIADMIEYFASVTLCIDDNRSKNICSNCLRILEDGLELREHIRANERLMPTMLQSIDIQDAPLSEQDYEFEYLEEFKDQIIIGDSEMPVRETFKTEENHSDTSPGEGEDDTLAKEEMESVQLDVLEQGKFSFVMPPPERIANRLVFEDFEYLEIRGERCCGCAHIASSRDDLVAHAKKEHSQNYYADSSYTCPTCYEKFSTEEALTKHGQYYLYSDVFLCTACEEAFNFQSHLKLHLKQCHQQDPHNVDEDHRMPKTKSFPKTPATPITTLPDAECIKQTREFPQYREHLLCGERCCACGLYLVSVEPHATEVHIELEDVLESSNDLKCNICKRTFASRQQRMLHDEERRNFNQLYECRPCGMLFARKHLLLKHFRSAKNHGPLEDGSSAMTDSNTSDATGKDANRVECFCCCFTRCKEEYATERELLQHAHEVHSGRRKENEGKLTESTSEVNQSLVCPVCRRMFDSEEKLERHRSYKLHVPKQTCPQCGQVFMKSSGLREHQIRKHLNVEAQFACEVCGKHFVNRGTLNKHRAVHGPFKNFPCSAEGCDALFRDEALMRRHYRNVHREIKPYECAHCKKLFRTKESLDIHQRTHTGERPFACRYEECPQRYAHATDRKRHERSVHTGEKPHVCPVCGSRFLRKREMRLHVEKVH